MEKKVLYKTTARGTINQWSIEVQGTAIVTEWGKVGGKQQRHIDDIKVGKNIGRANETTPEQQAVLEAESKYKARLRKGYTITPGEKDLTPRAMLALSYDDFKHKIEDNYVYIQPKLNGHRCLAFRDRDTGEIVLLSRGNKRIEGLHHIKNALDAKISKDSTMVYDGELYKHGESLQTITSWIRNSKIGGELLQYWLYDSYDIDNLEQPQSARIVNLGVFRDTHNIILTPTNFINSGEERQKYKKHYLSKGYEGAIIRTVDNKYRPGARSQGLLKDKAWHDAEYVVRHITTTIYETEGFVYCVPVLHFDNFKATAPGNIEEKRHIAENPEMYVGKKVTVQYAEITADGVPFHPVALQIRDDI